MKYKVGDKVLYGKFEYKITFCNAYKLRYSIERDCGNGITERIINVKEFELSPAEPISNYAYINGERIDLPAELDADQRRALGIKPKFDIELHLELSRLLWQFAIENGGVPDWKDKFYYIFLGSSGLHVTSVDGLYYTGQQRFASPEACQRAIDEIVKPFLAAHPDFRW